MTIYMYTIYMYTIYIYTIYTNDKLGLWLFVVFCSLKSGCSKIVVFKIRSVENSDAYMICVERSVKDTDV